MKYYKNILPRFWFLNPWSHAIRLFNATQALKADIDTKDDTIKQYSRITKQLLIERDRAVIRASKYYYKYQDLADENFVGDTE